MEKINSPIHHSKLEKSISPSQHWKMEKIISPFHLFTHFQLEQKRQILPSDTTNGFPEDDGKGHVPDYPDPKPSLSYSSSKKKQRDKIKKMHKHRKTDSSDPSSSDDSNSSDNSGFRHKRRKRKSHWKKGPFKLCARLTAKLLTTAYKSNIIMFKMDEDPLQRQIYFLTFVKSLQMIFSKYSEICEEFLDYPRMGVLDIKGFAKKAIRNISHANNYVHSRRRISEFPADGIKCNEKLQLHCANRTFGDKSRYDKIFQQVTNLFRS